ncbi:DUF456 domain-containing protein [Thermoactinomyces sp. DSM 45892]|uniref:DUF456 domain-containing protein n=1 Tax=Thermoactinomyces sp. DSM 45892 TaxID=1882753 RepID=UPI00089BD009|nr:DUF456 domain-containing protein [Thermoactinomyces sp. DSM 45892]SDY99186.1 hypothetical protein SAMN05444416_11156 [Thermoactinomyces sp. DSM 45892]
MVTITVVWIIIIALFALGFLGLIFPVLPDVPLLMAGFAMYHFFVDDQALGLWFWIITSVVMVLSFLVDNFASGIAAKKAGGSSGSFWAAALGAIVFSLFLGPLGVIVGPFVFVLVVEWIRTQDFKKAFSVGISTLIGFIGGILVKLIILIALLVWFFVLI